MPNGTRGTDPNSDGSEGSDDLGGSHGEMLRPEAVVLDDECLVPPTNILDPPPNRFTHHLALDEPFRFDPPEVDRDADGVLPAGTPVLLVVDGHPVCRVATASGLYVDIRRDSLIEHVPGVS